MTSFVVNSLIASLVLTALINVIPRLFPGSSAEDRVREMVGEDRRPPQNHEATPEEPAANFRIWFPWKQMLLWSMAITVLLNVAQLLD